MSAARTCDRLTCVNSGLFVALPIDRMMPRIDRLHECVAHDATAGSSDIGIIVELSGSIVEAMSNEKLQELLSRLREELQQSELDDETRSSVEELGADIDDLLDSESDRTDTASVLDRANLLEASFATEHPTAERIVREVIETLVRMGI